MIHGKVLLTGATGVVGSAVRAALGDHQVTSLTFRNQLDRHSVTGDISRAKLGLADSGYRELASRVDTVVHCAAVTDFAADPETVHRLNVDGTEHVADFAADANARLIYLSTAFVARVGLTRGARGAVTHEAASRPEDYLDSKREAEALLQRSGVPLLIVRPSIVIGDSQTGAIARYQGMHTIVRAVLKNRLALAPFLPTSRLDVIPQDLLASAVRSLVDSNVQSGEYWLTAGQRALTAARMVEICLEVAEELHLEVTPPRLVPPDMVDRLIRPVFIDPLPRQARRQFDDLMAMAALFAGAEPFETSLGQQPIGDRMIELPSDDWFSSAFRASVLHLAHSTGLAPALTAVAV
jgi:nucleoside-diphosphate-sugar epimerase